VAGRRNTISAEGRAKAEEELRELTQVRRPEIVKAIKTAREFGDLKENAEYHAAREAQAMNESRIRVLEHHLASAEVAESTGGERAEVGSRVRFRDAATAKVTDATLVHPLEASIPEGKLSVESPIGRALLGATAGAEVTFTTPRGDARALEVLEVG
jgi:transcription elongation factor GreA